MEAIICKYCNSKRVVRHGFTPKGKQAWLCRNCGRGFIDNKAFPRYKNPTDVIADAINMYFQGLSFQKIAEQIKQKQGYAPARITILRWVNNFAKSAVAEANKYQPEVGDTWVADETVVEIDGRNVWCWDIICKRTRFLLATHLSYTRTMKDAEQLMRLAYERTGKAPKVIITDKLRAYLDGIELTFGADTKHIPSSPFEFEDSTAVIERFQGTLKDRTKVLRGLKSKETAKQFLDGWLVYYNFFRTQPSLDGKTPAQRAGIDFPFKDWAGYMHSFDYPMRRGSEITIPHRAIIRRKVLKRRLKRRQPHEARLASIRV